MFTQEIVVTGAEGFVGRRLVARLRALGQNVRALGGRSTLDVADAAAVERAIPSAGIIVHLAARVFVPDSFQDAAGFYRTNFLGTVNLLEAARRTGARFILSSAYVYGRPQLLPIREEHPLAAHSPYTETKIIAERILRSYHELFGVMGTILRPFNIYGPGQDERFLIPKILTQSRTGSLELQSSRPRRDFVYVDDVVEAFVKAVEKTGPGLETYNIGSGESWSVAELVDLVRSFHDFPLSVHYTEESRPQEIEDTRADISRACAGLNWTPVTTLRDGLLMTLKALP